MYDLRFTICDLRSSQVTVAHCCWILCGVLLLIDETAAAESVRVRLLEIFHPKKVHVESSGEKANSSPIVQLSDGSQLHANEMTIAVASSALNIETPDTSFHTATTEVVQILAEEGSLLVSLPGVFAHKQEPFVIGSRRNPEASSHSTEISSRLYCGILMIQSTGDELVILNDVALEDYVGGILAAEMPEAEPAALQAQAVVSRTFAARNRQRHAKEGHDFCDLTHCQAFKGIGGVTPSIKAETAATRDMVLVYDNEPIQAYYASTCGGQTASSSPWNGESQSYLRSIADAQGETIFCSSSPHYHWQQRIPVERLHEIWQLRLGDAISSIAITKRGGDGRVIELALLGRTLHLVSGEDFRTVVCRVLGWSSIKSTAFELTREREYVFAGRGLGHGLGLCQYGAMEMARRGYGYEEILQHYFPRTELRTRH